MPLEPGVPLVVHDELHCQVVENVDVVVFRVVDLKSFNEIVALLAAIPDVGNVEPEVVVDALFLGGPFATNLRLVG